MTRPVLALVPCLALALAARAGDLFVGPPGSGAAFPEIAEAVAFASPGDTIHVAPGTYDVFTVDKALRVLGAGSALVTVQNPANGTPVRIDGIPAGSEVVLSGLAILDPAVPAIAQHLLEVVNSPGRVVLHDVHVLSVPGGTRVPTLALVQNAGSLLVLDCRFVGEDATSGGGGIPLRIESSVAWIADSALLAGDNAPSSSSAPPIPHALDLFVSSAHVSRTELRGGDGSVATLGSTPFAMPGGNAIDCSGCNLVLAGGPGNVLGGGDGGVSLPFTASGGSCVGFGLGGVVDYADDIVFVPGLGTLGLPAPIFLEGPLQSTIEALGAARPTLSIDPPQVPIGQSLTLDLTGNPSALQLVALAFATGDPLTFPGVDSPWVLSPFPVVSLGTIALDGAGLGSLVLPIPPDPTLQGVLGLVQTAEVSAQLVGLSNPAGFVITG